MEAEDSNVEMAEMFAGRVKEAITRHNRTLKQVVMDIVPLYY